MSRRNNSGSPRDETAPLAPLSRIRVILRGVRNFDAARVVTPASVTRVPDVHEAKRFGIHDSCPIQHTP